MQAVLFVMVIAMWLPAVCDMSDTFVSVGLPDRGTGRCFQTYRFVKTRSGYRCIDEQQEQARRQKQLLPRRGLALIRLFMRYLYQAAHRCGKHQYHIVFTPEYGKRTVYNLYIKEIRAILIRVCQSEGVTIHKLSLESDCVHMFVRIPPGMSAPKFAGYLKRRSSLILFGKYETLKYQYDSRQFWSGGYYISSRHVDNRRLRRYVKEQEIRDMTDNKTNPEAHTVVVQAVW